MKHQSVAGQFIDDGAERAALGREIDERLESFARLCSSIGVLGELTQRGLDVVSGLGERLNAPLLAAVLRANGIPAEAVDAVDLVVTDKVFGGAEPIMSLTKMRCRKRLLPLIEAGVVPVVTGFVGATEDGIPTTLGRGGSDYSCAVVGAALDVGRNPDLDRRERRHDGRPAHGAQRAQPQPVELRRGGRALLLRGEGHPPQDGDAGAGSRHSLARAEHL